MKRASLILTLLILASLMLAACEGEQTSTSAPSTNAPQATGTSEMPATEASTSTTEATTSTPEANMTSTAGIPVTGGDNPSQRITSLIGFPVCGSGGDQLGTVQDMVLDFNQLVVTYMIVDADGKSVAVPYSFLAKPRMGAGTGTGTGSGTGPQAQSTDTPSAGVAVSTATSTDGTGTSTPSTGDAVSTATSTNGTGTSTPSAGVTVSTATSTTGTGTGTGSTGTGVSSQQNCLTLTLSNDLFNNAPAFNQTIMPGMGQSTLDWDISIMDYWVSGGQPPATETPAASGATDTTATATVTPGVQPMQGVILASDLLNASIVLDSQSAGTGTGSGTGTDSSLGTSTPSAGDTSSTAVPGTTATASSGGTGTGTGSGTGSTFSDNSQGTVQDVIIEPRIGKLQYLVVSLTTDTWIPVPISLLGLDATTSQFALMTSASMLQNAPSFSSSQFPDTSASGWGEQFSTYWSGGDAGSGTGSGASTTATATP